VRPLRERYAAGVVSRGCNGAERVRSRKRARKVRIVREGVYFIFSFADEVWC